MCVVGRSGLQDCHLLSKGAKRAPGWQQQRGKSVKIPKFKVLRASIFRILTMVLIYNL